VAPDNRILLVEDERIVALSTQRLLSQYGYSVTTASSGEEALARVASGDAFDIVLMDIDLGEGIDGTETASRMLELAKLPIVFHTSHSEREYVDRVKEITRYGYVLKNAGEFVLVEAITMARELFAAHQETLKHERRYRLIAENAGDFIATFDADLGLTYVSPSVSDVTGYTSDELHSVGVMSVVHEEDREALVSQIREAIENREVRITVAYRLIANGGDTRWVEAEAKFLYGDEGEFRRLVITARDATERRRVERELIEQSSLSRQIIQSANEGIVICDRELRYEVWNRYMERLTGFPAQEVIGRKPDEVFPFLKHSEIHLAMREALADGAEHSVQFYFSVPSRSASAWVDERVSPLRSPAGEIVGVILLVRDISDVKEKEGKLRAREETYRQLADNATDIFASFDGQFNVLYINPAAERILGYTLEDFADRSGLDIIHPEDRDEFEREMGKAIEKRAPEVTHTLRLLAQSGRTLWVETNSRLTYDKEGRLDFLTAISRDITERRARQEALEETVEHQEHLITELEQRVTKNPGVISSFLDER
jgi:PAS domain S-box-containing protein